MQHNLIAVSKLCDDDCSFYLYKHGVEVKHKGDIMFKGRRDQRSQLWRLFLIDHDGPMIIPLTRVSEKTEEHDFTTNDIYCSNIKDLTLFYHAVFFFPVVST